MIEGAMPRKIKELQKESLEMKRSYRLTIRKALRQNHQYSHNVISCSLINAEETHGTKFANSLIDEFSLPFNKREVEDES